MQDLCSRFGIDVYNAAFTALLDRNKRAIGSLILSQIPEEGVYFEDYIDDDVSASDFLFSFPGLKLGFRYSGIRVWPVENRLQDVQKEGRARRRQTRF